MASLQLVVVGTFCPLIARGEKVAPILLGAGYPFFRAAPIGFSRVPDSLWLFWFQAPAVIVRLRLLLALLCV